MNAIFDLPPQDPFEEGPQRLESLIDAVLCECPDAVLIVAKIIGNTLFQARVNTFNNALDSIVAARRKAGYKLWLADHSAIGGTDLEEDGLHPTRIGYEKMARAWFKAVQEFPAEWIQPARNPSLEAEPECRETQERFVKSVWLQKEEYEKKVTLIVEERVKAMNAGSDKKAD